MLRRIRDYFIPPPPPELARYRTVTPPPRRWQVPSHSKPGVTYTVTQRPRAYPEPDAWECTCPDHHYQARRRARGAGWLCKHIRPIRDAAISGQGQ